MFKDNKQALVNSYKFFKRNSKTLLTLVLITTLIGSINHFFSFFLLLILIGSLAFFIRDNELLDDLKTKRKLTFDILKHYLKYGLTFSLLFIFIILIIFILIVFFGVIFAFIMFSVGSQSDNFGIMFIISFFISAFFVMLLLSPFYFLLPIYINLILSSTHPLEIIKINFRLFSKIFWNEIFSMLKNKYFIKTSFIWTIVSTLIFIGSLIFYFLIRAVLIFLFSFIPLTPVISYLLIEVPSLFVMYISICYLFIYLVYISHYIKLNTQT